MPHCILEYSDNVIDTIDAQALFAELHRALIELEAFPLADVKSRAIRMRDYYVGDGKAHNSYAHMRFFLLSGRDISVRQRIVQTCLKTLEKHFEKTLKSCDIQLTVEVCELDRSTYGKTTSTPS